tara:strand:- start:2181 stop:2333 length:153 start_codon:yes stop_codon:yes gene_type:complete
MNVAVRVGGVFGALIISAVFFYDGSIGLGFLFLGVAVLFFVLSLVFRTKG